MNTKDKTLRKKYILQFQDYQDTYLYREMWDFISQALTNQKNQILELEEMREEEDMFYQGEQEPLVDEEAKTRNQLRKSLKKAIERI